MGDGGLKAVLTWALMGNDSEVYHKRSFHNTKTQHC